MSHTLDHKTVREITGQVPIETRVSPPAALADATTLLPAHATSGPSPASAWALDPTLTFLNHGSYGSVPRAVLRFQQQLRERVEADPVRFYKSDLEGLMDDMRSRLGAFLNTRPADLAPFPNATYVLCSILNNANLKPGDEVLVTDHEYQSLFNEMDRLCARTGARLVKASIPFPIRDPAEVIERFITRISPRTRLAFISHITSCTSLVFPVKPIIDECNRRGIDVVLDGAHSPGQIQVDVSALNPTFFVGSGHKWLSAPKGIGFLSVRADRQSGFRPLALSSRAAKIRHDRALFLRDFDYQGTDDYTGVLSLPAAIDTLGSMLPGAWPALLQHNHDLILKGRRILCDALGIEPPAPDSMIGAMATLPIPEPGPGLESRPTRYDDALQDALYERHRIVVPVWRFDPAPGSSTRVIRISAHLYNTVEQFERLAVALREELAREHARRATA